MRRKYGLGVRWGKRAVWWKEVNAPEGRGWLQHHCGLKKVYSGDGTGGGKGSDRGSGENGGSRPSLTKTGGRMEGSTGQRESGGDW